MSIIGMLIIGFSGDLILGDPPTWPHPVKLMGRVISLMTKRFNNFFYKPITRRVLGGIISLTVIGGFWFLTFFILKITGYFFWLNFLVGCYLCYTCLSIKSLAQAGKSVLNVLRHKDLKGARIQVGKIVGRDTNSLSEEGLCKATVETISENTSDGIIAPLFYLAIGGPSLGIAYKAVNTLDSMIGYNNDKYRDIGLVSAKLDDIFNYLPVRITWFLLILATFILKYNFRRAFYIGIRDRKNHLSPNAAYPEAVVAGALNICLGGPHRYFGKVVKKPYIGDKHFHKTTIKEIKKTIKLMAVSSVLGLIFLLILVILINKLKGLY